MIYSLDPKVDDDPQILEQAKEEILEPVTQEGHALYLELNKGRTRFARKVVPLRSISEISIMLTTTWINPLFFPDGYLQSSLIPIFVHPEKNGVCDDGSLE